MKIDWKAIEKRVRIFPQHDPEDIEISKLTTGIYISESGDITRQGNFNVEYRELKSGKSRVGDAVGWSAVILYIFGIFLWNKVPPDLFNIHNSFSSFKQWGIILKCILLIAPPFLAWRYAVTAYENGWRDYKRLTQLINKLDELKNSENSTKALDLPTPYEL